MVGERGNAGELSQVVGRFVADRHGSLTSFLEQLDAHESTALETLRHITVLIVGDNIPRPGPVSPIPYEEAEDKVLNRVCTKLRTALRKYRDLELSTDLMARRLVQTVREHWRRVSGEAAKVYAQTCPALASDDVDRVSPAQVRSPQPAPVNDDSLAQAMRRLVAEPWVPRPAAALMTLLLLWLDEGPVTPLPFTADDELDLPRVATALGISVRQLRVAIDFVRREVDKVTTKTPRPFRKVHEQLLQLASKSLGTLADSELRETLFNLSRDLAYSFGPSDGIAPGAKLIRKQEFSGTVDLLLDERALADADEYRSLVERQTQRVVRIPELLEKSDLAGAFSLSAAFVLDSARLQHHTSPERLQVLLAYIYFLFMGRMWDAYLEANHAVAERVDAIVRQKGAVEFDEPSEFDNGFTLRRLKTLATVNQISCKFHHTLTGAAGERFKVRDYAGLVDLVSQVRQLLAFDPGADTVRDEMLVIQAHVVRAAENRYRGRGVTAAEKGHWDTERQRQWKALHEIIEHHFMDQSRRIPDVQRLLNAADTAEGCAVTRTLDVLEEALHMFPPALQDMQTARLALMQRTLDE